MSAKDVEELSIIREEKRTLSMTVENVKSELSQLQSRVFNNFSFSFLVISYIYTVDVEIFSLFPFLGRAPSCDQFDRHSEWRKIMATKITTKIADLASCF